MTPDELSRFRGAYWQAARMLDTVRLRQWEQSRVTLPQLRVLYQVRRTPGITTSELSRLLGITVSTTSGLVIKLVDRGLLDRTTASDDRRQASLRLTREGLALTGELTESGRPFLQQVAARLGAELVGTTDMLERLAVVAEQVRAAETAGSGAADAEPPTEVSQP